MSVRHMRKAELRSSLDNLGWCRALRTEDCFPATARTFVTDAAEETVFWMSKPLNQSFAGCGAGVEPKPPIPPLPNLAAMRARASASFRLRFS